MQHKLITQLYITLCLNKNSSLWNISESLDKHDNNTDYDILREYLLTLEPHMPLQNTDISFEFDLLKQILRDKKSLKFEKLDNLFYLYVKFLIMKVNQNKCTLKDLQEFNAAFKDKPQQKSHYKIFTFSLGDLLRSLLRNKTSEEESINLVKETFVWYESLRSVHLDKDNLNLSEVNNFLFNNTIQYLEKISQNAETNINKSKTKYFKEDFDTHSVLPSFARHMTELYPDSNDAHLIKILKLTLEIYDKYTATQVEAYGDEIVRQLLNHNYLYPFIASYIKKFLGIPYSNLFRFFNYKYQMLSDLNEYLNDTFDEQDEVLRWNKFFESTKTISDSISMIFKVLKSHNLNLKATTDIYLELKSHKLNLKAAADIHMPLILTIIINSFPLNKQVSSIRAFEKFADAYNLINDNVTDRNQHFRHYPTFMVKHQYIICMLVDIMGEKAFAFLQKYMAGTVLSLDRLLTNLKILPANIITLLHDYFNRNQTIIMSDKGYRIWEEIVLKMGYQIEQSKDIHFKLYDDFTSLPLEQFNLKISESFLKMFFVIFPENNKIDVTSVLARFPSRLLVKLFAARTKMQDDEYCYVFDRMLEGDFKGEPFDPNQDPNLESLVAHNQNILDELKKAGINTELAMNYGKTTSFEINPDKEIQKKKKLISSSETIWKDISKVQDQTNQLLGAFLDSKFDNNAQLIELLKGIKTNITILQNTIKTPIELSEEHNLRLLNTINTSLVSLRANYASSLSNTFGEFSQHFQDRFKVFQDLIQNKEPKQTKIDKPKQFIIQQWNKRDPHTFFLGDYVGCCLATDGDQFQALVQRRMDDAMLFHTVIDKETNVPIALAWLYFAADKTNPGAVVLIANFLEITAKYGSDDRSQKIIIDELLKYTNNYCQDIGVKQFLINHLTYGWIDDFQEFTQQDFSPEKIGGAFVLSNENENENKNENHTATEKHYYLASLAKTSFHSYPLANLTNKLSTEQNVSYINTIVQSRSPIHSQVVVTPNSPSQDNSFSKKNQV